MIVLLRKALDLLDEQGREEVVRFLISQQNPDGGFQDRGGRSDLYYSLFGGLMLKAAEGPLKPAPGDLENRSAIRFRTYIKGQKEHLIPGFIEKCCLALLQKELEIGRVSRIRTLLSLGRSFLKERNSINLSYRSFVLFLTLDAALPIRGFLKMGSKRLLARTTIDVHSPCSEVAAKVFLLKMMSRNGFAEQELLKSLACESGGFKAFAHLQHADLLSTAVALFALKFSGADLRLLRPSCLDFIQANYSDGAFLSGDGDPAADVEYTFYGLLALGVLAD